MMSYNIVAEATLPDAPALFWYDFTSIIYPEPRRIIFSYEVNRCSRMNLSTTVRYLHPDTAQVAAMVESL